MIVLHVVLVLMNVPLRQLLRAISIKSILISVLIAVLAQMFAQLRQFILKSKKLLKNKNKKVLIGTFFI